MPLAVCVLLADAVALGVDAWLAMSERVTVCDGVLDSLGVEDSEGVRLVLGVKLELPVRSWVSDCVRDWLAVTV